MKKQIIVIIYTRCEDGSISHSMRLKRVCFWKSHRKVSQQILWELATEKTQDSTVITNIQIF